MKNFKECPARLHYGLFARLLFLMKNVVLRCAGLLLVSACSGSGSPGSAAPPPTPVTTLAVASFTSDSATIDAGQPSTLRWDVRGAASLTVSPGVGAVTGASVAVSPAITTAYTLTATDAQGKVTRAALTVNVNQASGPATQYPLLFVTQVPLHTDTPQSGHTRDRVLQGLPQLDG